MSFTTRTAQIKGKLAALTGRPWMQYVWLAVIILFAAALRFYRLGEWSFWFDEISTINRASSHYSDLHGLLQNIPPAINWIPLSVILTGFVTNALGISEWSSRLVPAVIGIISIPAIYFPTRKEFGTTIGLISALLLAVSPWHIEWSQNARFYSSLMLLCILALFAFYYALENDQPVLICLFLMLLYLATSERITALMIVPVVIMYPLLLKILPFEKPPGLRLRNLIIIFLAGVAFILYEIYGLISMGNSSLLDTFLVFSPNRGPDPARLLAYILFNIGIPLVCLAFFGGIYLLMKKNRSGLFFFLGAVIPVGLLLIANSFMYTDERYAFITLPSWIILGALATTEIFSETRNQSKVLAFGVLALLLANAAYSNLLYSLENNGNRLDWRKGFELIRERSVDGDLFVSYWPDLGTYYLGKDVLSLIDVNAELMNARGQRAWFVIDNFAVWSVSETSLWVERHCELIMSDEMFVNGTRFLHIYLCEPERITWSE
jgi:4-amino-4-deoxy-L-arabinose transferase-like glycosyltransferase